MPEQARISLEQWRCLAAVVDEGGYAQAAGTLHKSQSAVSYAVQKLEDTLGVKAFEIRGRKAVLTATGQFLYRRARALLDEAGALERSARRLAAGWEAEITFVVEVLFPTWLLLECLDSFGKEAPYTHIELIESVLGGTPEALLEGRADLAVMPRVPTGFLGDPLMTVRFVPVAHPDHPLHALGREVTERDLRHHRQILVRDTGARRDKSSHSLHTQQRWTVSNMPTSIGAICRGYGFAWLPEEKIRAELKEGQLEVLPLRAGRERLIPLYLVIADRDGAGPGTLRLAEIIRDKATNRNES